MDEDTYSQYEAQNAIQEEANHAQKHLAAPQMVHNQQQMQAVLVEQTNPKNVIKEIEYSLMNVEVQPDGTLISLGDPIMNNDGINKMKFIMRSIINQNTILSHLKDQEINKIILNLSDNIIDDLTLNWKEYGIKDKIALDHVVDSIIFPSFMALKRACNQNEKNWLGKVTVESITGGGGGGMRKPKRQSGFWEKFKL